MKIVTSIHEWEKIRRTLKGKMGFVPTMGALHEGHISLVFASRKENDITVVSIFVNPTQFNDPKDLQAYPRTFEQDAKKLDEAGVDYILSPSFEELYPDNYRYILSEKELSLDLCGKSRPGHFDGVLSVVMKLLNIVDAQRAYFGEKDYQQLLLIKGMVEAFFMKTQIVSCPIVREADGLAMSSRNVRLTSEGRKQAPLFYKELKNAKDCDEAKINLENYGFKIDYIEEKMNRRFGAVILDNVRLIDNVAR